MNEISDFKAASESNGLTHLIAFGAFEIGMESLLYRVAENFGQKIYMAPERRDLLECMIKNSDFDSLIRKLKKVLVPSPELALIHVLDVEKISMTVSFY